MKKGIYLIIYIVIAILAAGCTGAGVGENGHGLPSGDTLYTKAAAMAAHATQTSPQSYNAQFQRARDYCQSLEDRRLDSAIIICERLIEVDSVRISDTRTYDVLEVLVNACRMSRDDEGELRWATQLVDHCRKLGWDTEALRNEAEVGVVLTHLGNRNEGLAKIDSAISGLDGIRKFNELDASIIAMKRKMVVLKENEGKALENAEMIIAVAQRMLERLADYEQHPADYHDATYREPTEEDRPGYIDFYRSQTWSYLAYAYAWKNDQRQALHYLDLFLQSDFGQTLNGRESSAAIFALLGKYDRMLVIYDEWEREMGDDTVNANYATILRDRATAARAKGHVAEAYDLMCRHEALTRQLNDRLLRGKAHLYAARFHAQEQQREIDRQREAKHRAAIIGSTIAIVALLALLFALYVLRQWRTTQRRNRILAWQITEASRMKTEYAKLKTEKTPDAATFLLEKAKKRGYFI